MTPQSEAELAEAIAGATGPLAVRGGGTRGLTGTGDPLETGGLTGITLHEPGALTLVARAGTPLAEVEAALAAEGQRLAFEPMDHRALLGTTGEPTIGGVVAANVSGPRRVQAGACRDFLLGLRFVDGRGTVVKNGGRVMKNVTGYDLVKLLCGSRGALGVLSEVSLKVLPLTETEATLCLPAATPAEAVRLMSAALGSPFEVTGAAWRGGEVLLRLEGFAESVAYRAGRLRDLLAADARVMEQDASRDCWRQVRDVAPFHGAEGTVWRLSAKPSDAPGIVARLEADETLLDWGGGLIWARAPEGEDLRARMGAPGHATLVRGDGFARHHPEPPAVAALTTGLRQRFDPRGLFAGA